MKDFDFLVTQKYFELIADLVDGYVAGDNQAIMLNTPDAVCMVGRYPSRARVTVTRKRDLQRLYCDVDTLNATPYLTVRVALARLWRDLDVLKQVRRGSQPIKLASITRNVLQ